MAELRKRHIIGAKIRVFCVRHERCPMREKESSERGKEQVMELETAYFVSHPLAILNGCKDAATNSLNDGDKSSRLRSSSLSMRSYKADLAYYEHSILMGLPHVVVHRMDETSPMMPPRPVWYDKKGLHHGPTTKEVPSASSLLTSTEEGLQSRMIDPPSQEEITSFLYDRQAEIIIFLEGTW